MKKISCRIGTRKSALARVQSQGIHDRLSSLGAECELVEIVSEGDKNSTNPLYSIETDAPGLFCKQLEEALLAGQIDIAVHSLKDLPTTQPQGLFVGAISAREVVYEVLLIHPSKKDFGEKLFLAHGATIGTSSLRREAQLLDARPDLKTVPIRGNVPTRVAQVREGKVDGTILAAAGLVRLSLDLSGVIRVDLLASHFVPAPGQGALAIELRRDCDPRLSGLVGQLNDPVAEKAVGIERRIMRDLEGGCTLPLGVLCQPSGDGWHVLSFLGLALGDRGEARRHWVSFHRFDISGHDEETLVAKTVRYFKDKGKQ